MISRLLLVKLHTMNQNIQNDCRKLKMMETLYHIQLQHKCLVYHRYVDPDLCFYHHYILNSLFSPSC